MEQASYWRHAKRTSPARITTEGNDLKQQTASHNHAVDVVDTQVKAIQSDIRKRAVKKFLYSTIHIYYCKCDQALNVQRLGISSPFVRRNGIRPNGIGHICDVHRCLQSSVGTWARLGYAAFDVQLWKAYFFTTLYDIRMSMLLVYSGSSRSVFFYISTRFEITQAMPGHAGAYGYGVSYKPQ